MIQVLAGEEKPKEREMVGGQRHSSVWASLVSWLFGCGVAVVMMMVVVVVVIEGGWIIFDLHLNQVKTQGLSRSAPISIFLPSINNRYSTMSPP